MTNEYIFLVWKVPCRLFQESNIKGLNNFCNNIGSKESTYAQWTDYLLIDHVLFPSISIIILYLLLMLPWP